MLAIQFVGKRFKFTVEIVTLKFLLNFCVYFCLYWFHIESEYFTRNNAGRSVVAMWDVLFLKRFANEWVCATVNANFLGHLVNSAASYFARSMFLDRRHECLSQPSYRFATRLHETQLLLLYCTEDTSFKVRIYMTRSRMLTINGDEAVWIRLTLAGLEPTTSGSVWVGTELTLWLPKPVTLRVSHWAIRTRIISSLHLVSGDVVRAIDMAQVAQC